MSSTGGCFFAHLKACVILDARFQVPTPADFFILHVLGMMIWQHAFFSGEKVLLQRLHRLIAAERRWYTVRDDDAGTKVEEELICMGFRDERRFGGVPGFRARAFTRKAP